MDELPVLSFTTHHPHCGRAAVTLPAEIDVTNTGQLHDELDAVLDRGVPTVIVDMSRTTFCDSAASRVLLHAYRRARGMQADLRLVVTQQAVRRLFEINGMDQIMPIYASLDAAESGIADAARHPASVEAGRGAAAQPSGFGEGAVVVDPRHPVRQAVGSAGQSAAAGIARQLSELARELQADDTQDALLTRIVRAAVTDVPGAGYAGITLLADKQYVTAVASDGLVTTIDRMQYQTGEGPCLDSARRRETVRSDDLRSERRWPRFAGQAAGLGVLSVLSLQLFVETESFGALNIYSGKAAAFTRESESTGMLLASHAALAMISARREARLLTAIDTRDLIGQAKGILIERYKITGVEAFGLLVASSQTMNRKLRDIAAHLVTTGELLTPSG